MRSKEKRNRKRGEAAPAPSGEKAGRVIRMLDIPSSALAGVPQIELSGNREAVVEGCQGVLEYDDTVIRLVTSKMSIKFSGRDLRIRVLTHDSAVVDGFITSIEFIT